MHMNSYGLTYKSFNGKFWWQPVVLCRLTVKLILVTVISSHTALHCSLWLYLLSLGTKRLQVVRVD